jgi:hypothetical protein
MVAIGHKHNIHIQEPDLCIQHVCLLVCLLTAGRDSGGGWGVR